MNGAYFSKSIFGQSQQENNSNKSGYNLYLNYSHRNGMLNLRQRQ